MAYNSSRQEPKPEGYTFEELARDSRSLADFGEFLSVIAVGAIANLLCKVDSGQSDKCASEPTAWCDFRLEFPANAQKRTMNRVTRSQAPTYPALSGEVWDNTVQ